MKRLTIILEPPPSFGNRINVLQRKVGDLIEAQFIPATLEALLGAFRKARGKGGHQKTAAVVLVPAWIDPIPSLIRASQSRLKARNGMRFVIIAGRPVDAERIKQELPGTKFKVVIDDSAFNDDYQGVRGHFLWLSKRKCLIEALGLEDLEE